MNQTLALLRAIESLRPELGRLVGEDSARFEAQLDEFLKQLETEPDRAPVVCALIVDLFSRYAQAHRRLIEVMAEVIVGICSVTSMARP